MTTVQNTDQLPTSPPEICLASTRMRARERRGCSLDAVPRGACAREPREEGHERHYGDEHHPKPQEHVDHLIVPANKAVRTQFVQNI